jgi:hypothetical protein
MNEMNIPGFAAEASLYPSWGLYRHSGGSRGLSSISKVVAADAHDDCVRNAVLLAEGEIVATALLTGGFGLVALGEIVAEAAITISHCPPPSGGGGGTPVGTGKRCCERDDNGRCTFYVSKNQVCP